jgi:hypothetical protein
MKHITAARLFAACLSVSTFAPAAFAEDPPDISGRWKFKTVLEATGCVITGEIRFRKAPAPLDYVCTFRSREDCDRAPPTFTEVDQSCMARVTGGEIAITSKVEKIADAGPPDFAKAMIESQAYQADNFLVHFEKGELVGLFYSMNRAMVRFWRDVDLVS